MKIVIAVLRDIRILRKGAKTQRRAEMLTDRKLRGGQVGLTVLLCAFAPLREPFSFLFMDSTRPTQRLSPLVPSSFPARAARERSPASRSARVADWKPCHPAPGLRVASLLPRPRWCST